MPNSRDFFIIERLARIGILDPNAYIEGVEEDISIAQNWKPRSYK